jgi:hypothetical protein
MLVKNIFSPGENTDIVLAMDAKHVIKRIRNNVLSSGDSSNCTRLLTRNEHVIVWGQWKAAYEWDQVCNPEMMRVHHRLSEEHINVSDSGKMRNHLAEECLNVDMYNLMLKYQMSLQNGDHLTAAVHFLKMTSCMVSIFNDDRPIIELSDVRLTKLAEVRDWFKEWYNGIMKIEDKTAGQKRKMLMSRETCDDVRYCITGFISICETRIADGYSVMPSRINSDVIEKKNCQQRARNGDNTNPTYLQYRKNINTIALGQCSKGRAKKSNVGIKGAEPFNFNTPRPLRL